MGNTVFLRGLVELSNYCVRQCHYCGIRGSNTEVKRYRMEADEVLACARECERLGYGTIVMQAGEDYALTSCWVSDVIRRIKVETKLAITLSLGERRPHELREWKLAGADRYLLRFETSNPELFTRIHPPLAQERPNRLELLRLLRGLGYEVGSGVMIGIPGQTFESLADDILLFNELELDMIGVGPYIPHPDTPLGSELPMAAEDQVPADELTTYKVLALTRLMCPTVNIPSTTALATLNPAHGREFGLMRGANIVMPNVTPVRYREDYEIYPNKTCVKETAIQCEGCVKGRILRIGRAVGVGRGDSLHMKQRRSDGQEITANPELTADQTNTNAQRLEATR